MRQLLFISCITLFITINSTAQSSIRYLIQANAGLSSIPVSFPDGLFFMRDYSPQYVLSGDIGFAVEFKLGNRFFIETGLGYLYLHGEDIFGTDIRFENNAGMIESNRLINTSDLHTHYLVIPTMMKFKMKKLQLEVGAQVAYFLDGKRNDVNNQLTRPTTFLNISETRASYKLKLNAPDFGPKLGISYAINETVRINTAIYYGLIELNFETVLEPYSRKNRQWTVGIDYYL